MSGRIERIIVPFDATSEGRAGIAVAVPLAVCDYYGFRVDGPAAVAPFVERRAIAKPPAGAAARGACRRI